MKTNHTLITPVGGWQCSRYISSTHFNPEDGGSTVSKTLVFNNQTTWCNNS